MPTQEQILKEYMSALSIGIPEDAIREYFTSRGWAIPEQAVSVGDLPIYRAVAAEREGTLRDVTQKEPSATEYALGLTSEARADVRETRKRYNKLVWESAKDWVTSLGGGAGMLLKGRDYTLSGRLKRHLYEKKGIEPPPDPLVRTGHWLTDVALAQYERVAEAQANFIESVPEGFELPAALASTGTWFAIQTIPPNKPLSVILGIPLKAAAAGYGAYRLTQWGVREARYILRAAEKLGHVQDAARPMDLALEVASSAERAAVGAAPEEVVRLARNVARQEEMFPFAPRHAFAKDIPEAAIDAARREQEVLKIGNPPAVFRQSLYDDIEDAVLKSIDEDIAKSHLEILRREEYAASLADDIPRTPPPADFPEIIRHYDDKTGYRMARQYIYNRDVAKMVAARVEILTKRILSSGNRKADAALMEDMTGFIQGQGNAKVSHTDTVQDVWERMNAHPRRDKVVDLSANYRERHKQMLIEMNDLQFQVGDKEISPLDNYLHQSWKDYGSKLRRSQLRWGAHTIKQTGDYEYKRNFANYFIGMTKGGLSPRTLNAVEIMHLTERKYGEMKALKQLFRDLAELNIAEDGLPIFVLGELTDEAAAVGSRYTLTGLPVGKKIVSNRKSLEHLGIIENAPGYTLVENRFLRKMLQAEKGEPIYIKTEVWKPIERALMNVPDVNIAGALLDELAAILKRSAFTFTMFHAYTLGESAIAMMGPRHGLLAAYRIIRNMGGAIPMSEEAAARLGGAKAMSRYMGTGSYEVSERMHLMGSGTLGPPRTDLMVREWERLMRAGIEGAESLGKKLGGEVGAKIGRATGESTLGVYLWAQRNVDAALWDRFHHPMKVYATDMMYHHFKRIKAGEFTMGDHLANVFTAGGRKRLSRRLQDMSDDEILRSVASFTNDEFGGQNWDAHVRGVMGLVSQPNFLKWMRRVFISPDWNISSFRSSLAFAQAVPGTRVFDPVRGSLGLRHWRNAFFGTYVYANILNQILSGRFIWQNAPGKDRFHINTGMKDANGKELYWRFAKQHQELYEMVISPRSFLSRKTYPFYQMLPSPFRSPENYPTSLGRAIENAAREGRELDNLDTTLMWAQLALENARPFSYEQGKALITGEKGPRWIHVVPLPVSTGMSAYRARILMAEAYREDDLETVERVRQSMLDNGYAMKDVIYLQKSARTLARKHP